MNIRLVALLLGFGLLFLTEVRGADQIISGFGSNNQIVSVDTVTGATRLIATGGLDTIYSGDKQVIDLATYSAFQYGVKNGINSLETIQLATGTSSFATLNLVSPVLGGIYNGSLSLR